jgi:hypothetical protein
VVSIASQKEREPFRFSLFLYGNRIPKITHPWGKGWVTIDVLEIGESPNGKHFWI